MKRFLFYLSGALFCLNVAAQDLHYGFDGDLGTVLVASELTDNTFPFEQVAGRLVYHNDGQLVEDTTTIMEILNFHPTKSVSWTLQMDVTIPSVARIDNPVDGAECNLVLGCYNNKDGSLRFFTFEYALTGLGELSGDRQVRASGGIDDNEPFAHEATNKVYHETAQLKIAYFGGTVNLFAANLGSGNDLVFRMDIDPGGINPVPNIMDWGLAPEDTFTFFIGANCSNYPIFPDRPLQIDNLIFIDHAQDQDPAGLTVKPDVVSYEVKAFQTGASMLQKSYDLERWITVKTLSRGMQETLYLPSDNGKAFYRVVANTQ